MGLAGKPLVVLAYHGLVLDTRSVLDDFCFVTPRKIDADLSFAVKSGWRLIGLREGLAALENGSLRSASVAVTFDDGFSSVVDLAGNILRKHLCPATIFIPSAHIRTGEKLWFTRVISALKRTSLSEFIFLGRTFELNDFGARCQASRRIQNLLRCLHPQAISGLVNRLEAVLKTGNHASCDEFRLMSEEECQSALLSDDFDFGGHSSTHAIHTQLDRQQLLHEISDSLSFSDNFAKSGVRLYAYPNGRKEDFSSRCEKILAGQSVYGALTTVAGWNFSLKNRYALRRFCIGPETDMKEILSPWRWQTARLFQ
ncbi:MAG: hypothetical protein EBR09_02510 [Proteobacteria bacterium]|nr:hypothetical protein [Pseudomonadota bacterium]